MDFVGGAKRLQFLGSLKWLECSTFDSHDLLALQRHRHFRPDDPIPLLAISRFGPDDLLTAWQRRA